MARKAKEHTFYNNCGGTFTGTIPELNEAYGDLTRTNLYKPRGACDEEGIIWRIGEAPEVMRVPMGTSRQTIFNAFEQGVLDYNETGDTGVGFSVDELKAAINSYKANFYILECQSLDNNHTV